MDKNEELCLGVEPPETITHREFCPIPYHYPVASRSTHDFAHASWRFKEKERLLVFACLDCALCGKGFSARWWIQI